MTDPVAVNYMQTYIDSMGGDPKTKPNPWRKVEQRFLTVSPQVGFLEFNPSSGYNAVPFVGISTSISAPTGASGNRNNAFIETALSLNHQQTAPFLSQTPIPHLSETEAHVIINRRTGAMGGEGSQPLRGFIGTIAVDLGLSYDQTPLLPATQALMMYKIDPRNTLNSNHVSQDPLTIFGVEAGFHVGGRPYIRNHQTFPLRPVWELNFEISKPLYSTSLSIETDGTDNQPSLEAKLTQERSVGANVGVTVKTPQGSEVTLSVSREFTTSVFSGSTNNTKASHTTTCFGVDVALNLDSNKNKPHEKTDKSPERPSPPEGRGRDRR